MYVKEDMKINGVSGKYEHTCIIVYICKKKYKITQCTIIQGG